METTKSWRNVMGALDRRHNYSSQGILDNVKTIKKAGRKLIVGGITIVKLPMKTREFARIMAAELASEEERHLPETSKCGKKVVNVQVTW